MGQWWEACVGLVAGNDGHGLLFHTGEETFDIPSRGAASHTEYGADRMTVYSDLDGDGVVDQVSTVMYDGTYQVFQRADGGDGVGGGGWADDSDWGSQAQIDGFSAISPEKGSNHTKACPDAGGWACIEWG